MTFARTGATDATLSVAVQEDGPVGNPTVTAVFAAGSSTTVIPVVPSTATGIPASPGVIHFTLLDGDDYDLGVPSTATVSIVINAVRCIPTTTSTITVPSGPAALPRTGASGTTGLAVVAGALVIGGGLCLSRRRRY